jgi:hypothetical protein
MIVFVVAYNQLPERVIVPAVENEYNPHQLNHNENGICVAVDGKIGMVWFLQ